MYALLTLFASPAAADVPTYQWQKGETVRYYVESELYWSAGIKASARLNVSTRIRDLKLRAEVECTVKMPGKLTELDCRLAWLDLAGEPVSDPQGRVDLVMADWEEFTRPVQINIVIGPDGRLREFDCNGLPEGNIVEGKLSEQMRSFLRAAFSPLDISLPTDAKDWVRGWVRKDLSFMMLLPVTDGTAGAGTLKLFHVDDRLGLALISTEGRATVGQSSAVEASANGGLIDLRLGGEAWVDVTTGQLLFSGFTTDGRRTASASTGTADQAIAQSAALQRVAAFEADHKSPISVVALRAPKADLPLPEPPPGAPVVPFSELAMSPLFIVGYPQIAVPYELPTSVVGARVVVDAEGVPTSFKAVRGYEVLLEHVERGLKEARFPKRGGTYVVDLDVEVRVR
ncbi:MAG: hypothetical protein EXR71_15685 [Myxococcales bacterium]|nr:hypothetical protein [Myxococcales bacterium]